MTTIIKTIAPLVAGAVLAALFASAPAAHAGKIYRCVDEQTKKVTMSDQVCTYTPPKNAKGEQGGAPEPDKKPAEKTDPASHSKKDDKK